MEFSASSEAFIHTPGTRSEIATVIQVEFLFFWKFWLELLVRFRN
jgi:hypothetical protein